MAQKKPQGTIAVLDAKEQLYGRRMTMGKAMQDVLKWEAIFFAYAVVALGFNLLHLLWFIPIGVLVFLWVWKQLLPKKVEQAYQMQAYAERNQFVNLVTQEMAMHTITMQGAIKDAMENANGEFSDDLSHLVAILSASSSRKDIHRAFMRLQKKYDDDIYFARFIEQCETTYWETSYRIENFKTFKDSHDMVLEKMNVFRAYKKQAETNMYIILGLIGVLAFVSINMSSSFGSPGAWTGSIIGNIISDIWMLMIFVMIVMFYRNYFDDSVLTF